MKTKFFFAALTAVALMGCGKAEPETPIVPEESDYKGTVTVQYQGEPFDNENIEVNFTPPRTARPHPSRSTKSVSCPRCP